MNAPFLRLLAPITIALVLATSGCNMLDVYDRQIANASRAIETAKDDAERAAAYADRGRGYSDKARLSIQRKLIDRSEYVRLFTLAVKDHDQAVALDPASADVLFKRGLSYYDRAFLAGDIDPDHQSWCDAARMSFAAAVEKDARHASAFDYLGLVDEQTGRFDEAIADYTSLMALDARLGKMRLADLYCNKRYDAAAADFERSIALGAKNDGCSCEPYNSLAYIYIDVAHEHDKGRDLVRKARSAGQWIAPEYIERLQKQSGQNG